MRERLNGLTEKQRSQCANALKKYAGKVLELSRGEVDIHWYHGSKIVQQLSDGERGVDAITNPRKNSVTIDEKRFLALDGNRRVALLSHELLHLVEFDGKFLGDEGEYGEFKGKQGQRDFLDAVATGIAVFGASLIPSPETRSLQNISRANKKYWIGFSGGQVTLDKNSEFLLIDKKIINNSAFAFQYQPGLWGLRVASRNYSYRRNTARGFSTDLNYSSVETGVLYRLFPFDHSSSRMGQWFINAGVAMNYSWLEYELSDEYVKESSHSRTLGATMHADSMFPIVHNFWLHLALTARYQPHELREFSTKFDSIEIGYLGGVFYAW